MQSSSPPPAEPHAVSSAPSLKEVRALARLLRESGLSEVSIEGTDAADSSLPLHLTLRRTPTMHAAPALALPVAAPNASVKAPVVAAVSLGAANETPTTPTRAVAPEGTTEAATSKAASGEIMATAVGLFREAKPPLAVGNEVKKGQVVGFVESLKVPSEIHAPHAGQVSALLCEAGQGVEYGQILMRLEAKAESEAPQGESS